MSCGMRHVYCHSRLLCILASLDSNSGCLFSWPPLCCKAQPIVIVNQWLGKHCQGLGSMQVS